MNQPKIGGIGEILWDVLPDREVLGGAPINFVHHVSELGAQGIGISTIGNDQRGQRTLQELADKGIDHSCISISEHFPTGYVIAELNQEGVATYRFPDRVAWDYLNINHAAQQAVESLDAICFGTLAQRSKNNQSTVIDFISATRPDCLKVYDMNLRQHSYTKEIIETSLQSSNILKLNDDELNTLSSLSALHGNEIDRLSTIYSRYHLKLVILTKGDQGSVLFTGNGISTHPGLSTPIVDTIGAGDSFTAATVIGLLNGKSLDEINCVANKIAAYVCSQPGAMVNIPDDLKYQTAKGDTDKG